MTIDSSTDASRTGSTPAWHREFLQRHQLDKSFLITANNWLKPLVNTLARQQQRVERPMLVALNGCQGSGKTTIADFVCESLAQDHALRAVALSLDDFYFTRAQRERLATAVHPLLLTRGVPGTHDISLLRDTLKHLLDTQRSEPVAIPRFDKAVDDRRAPANWDSISESVQLILLEGWCLGVTPQIPEQLSPPMSELERIEDPDGRWRDYSNTIVQREFLPLYALVDQWIMLHAPSFDCVFEWRREQERKLGDRRAPEKTDRLMDDASLRRFIQHYERFTRQCLDTLPRKVHHLFSLNEQRDVTAYSYNPQAMGPVSGIDANRR